MNTRLDLILVTMIVLFTIQLEWRPLPERAFQAVGGVVLAIYIWQLVVGYRRRPEGESGPPGASRWVLVGALAFFIAYVAVRFMWTAAG